jgi:hypothetical protein
MLTFRNYLADRRYMGLTLSQDAWVFVLFALGDARYLDVGCWAELKTLMEQDRLSPQLNRGASRVWKSYLTWRRRKRSALTLCYA